MDRRDTDIVDAFARFLQERRRALGLSQEELAHRAGLSTSYVSLLESRKRQPTLTVLYRLSKELGLSLPEASQAIADHLDPSAPSAT